MDQDLAEIFPGNSEMAQVMRAHDWSATPLGDPQNWPDALKIPLRMLLTSRFEMWLGWGDELCFFYNDAYIPTLGIKHPTMLGRPFRQVWSEVYDEVADQVAKVRAGESTWNRSLLLLLERSGYAEETYHSFSYSPLHEASGSVGGLLCVVSEDTARVISERRLETLRTLGIALSGTTTRAQVHAAVDKAFAANRRDFPFIALSTGDDGEDARGIAARVWGHVPATVGEGGQVFSLPADVAWPSGEWEQPPTEALALPVPGRGGGPALGTLVLALNPYRNHQDDLADVAQLAAAQISGALGNVTAIDGERRRAERIWSLSRDIIVVVDENGTFRSVSPAWTRILGHAIEDVAGRPFADFMHPDDVVPSNGALARALDAEELSDYENRFRATDGTYRQIQWHTTLEGGLVYAYGRDVTERERTQKELDLARETLFQSQKMEAIGKLTGGVAHDFNNLLMAVMSSLELLGKRLPDDPASRRLFDNAVEGAQRGATLTQRMLAFGRRQDLNVTSINLIELIAGMSDLMQRSIGPEWPISTTFPIALPAVRADANQLETALLNLIVNARDASPSGGAISISAAVADADARTGQGLRAGQYVRLTVTDKGTGMDADTLQRATEPFFTTKGVGKGTGLGLSMVHGMAQQIGGTLTLESREGEGTSAVLWLPLADDMPVTEQAGKNAVENRETAMLNILAVDDDVLVLMNTVALLEDLGHTVLEADSGKQALAILNERDDIDLLVTDQAMPNMTGVELIQALEETRKGIPAIIASGYGEGVSVPGRAVVRLGKPFSQAQLAGAVAEATRG